MSVPAAVFLDTSILDGQQYDFQSAALKAFQAVVGERGLKYLIPLPMRDEVLRHLRERNEEVRSLFDKVRKTAPYLVGWKHFPPVSPPQKDWELDREARVGWDSFLRQFDVVELGYESLKIYEVMRWYDEQQAPFGPKKRHEFPDAIAIALLDDYSEKNNCIVAVVSSDQDFKRACERYPSLLYFRTLAEMTEVLLVSDEAVERIRARAFEDLGPLEREVLEHSKSFEFRHESRHYEIVNTFVHSVEIAEVRLVGVGSGECTLAIQVEVEAEHHLRWLEEGWDEDDVVESKWVVELHPWSGTAKVELDASTGRMKAVISLAIDAGFDLLVVTENPRNRW